MRNQKDTRQLEKSGILGNILGNLQDLQNMIEHYLDVIEYAERQGKYDNKEFQEIIKDCSNLSSQMYPEVSNIQDKAKDWLDTI